MERIREEKDIDIFEELEKSAQEALKKDSSELPAYGAILDMGFLSRALSRPEADEDKLLAIYRQFVEDKGYPLDVSEQRLVDDPNPRYRLSIYHFVRREREDDGATRFTA